MCSVTQILEVRQTAQNGDKKLKDLGLRAMRIGLLAKGDPVHSIDQSDLVGKLTPHDQKGMIGQPAISVRRAHSHASSCDVA
jgi:hypothetical protein